jgi:hypothetical protein
MAYDQQATAKVTEDQPNFSKFKANQHEECGGGPQEQPQQVTNSKQVLPKLKVLTKQKKKELNFESVKNSRNAADLPRRNFTSQLSQYYNKRSNFSPTLQTSIQID